MCLTGPERRCCVDSHGEMAAVRREVTRGLQRQVLCPCIRSASTAGSAPRGVRTSSARARPAGVRSPPRPERQRCSGSRRRSGEVPAGTPSARDGSRSAAARVDAHRRSAAPSCLPSGAGPRFEVRTSPSPSAMEQALAEKLQARQNARMAAGYCWTWSDPRPDGSLVPDARIGDWFPPLDPQGRPLGRRRPARGSVGLRRTRLRRGRLRLHRAGL